MILFYGEGRLGNQIFQYQAINSIAGSKEPIIAIGLEELHRVFELQDSRLLVPFHNIHIKRLFKFVINPLLLYPLARWLRLFNYAEEPASGSPPRKGNSGELRLRRGLFTSLTFINGGYYQNPSLWKTVFPPTALKLDLSLRNEVLRYLHHHVPPHQQPVFVHVRRGDYLNFHSYGITDLALPETFYRRAMRLVSNEIEDVCFVFVTDDPCWVSEQFADIGNKCVVSVSARFDFALMTQCRGGILSNSTYSLCAALMMDNPAVVVGPQYWFGFRINAWYPPRIQVTSKSMRYIPVLDQAA